MLEDSGGYRAALINAFRARGIRPKDAISYSEESLNWQPYHGIPSAEANPNFRKLWRDLMRFEGDPASKREKRLYQRLWGKAETFRFQLGLSPTLSVQAKSLNPLHRVRPDGTLQSQIVAELVQKKKDKVPVLPANKKAGSFTFRGGTTVIINRQGEVRYSISKPIDGPAGEERLQRQRDYLCYLRDSFSLAPYIAFDLRKDFGFRGVHRGY